MAVPSKTSLIAPAGPLADGRTFRFTASSATALTAWDVQVTQNADLSGTLYWYAKAQATGIAGANVAVAYGGTVLPVGPKLWWRARCRNAEGFGPWSVAVGFSVNASPPATRDPWYEWAQAILGAMGQPRVALIPGTIHPTGAHVRPLVTSEVGARWRLDLPDQIPPVFADLAVVGLAVEVDATGWTVTATTGRVGSQGRSGDYFARVKYLGATYHWRLGEPSGVDRTSSIGAAPGVPSAGGALQDQITPWGPMGPDEPDGSLRLNGSGYLEHGDSFDATGTAVITFAGWVRPFVAPAGLTMRIISKEGATDGYRIEASSTVLLRRTTSAGSDVAYGPPNTLAMGVWSHYVAMYDGAAITVYVNGVAGTPVPSTRALPGNTAIWTMGRASGSASSSTFLNGHLDEVSVFHKTLTPGEIAYLYNGGK